jgi:cytochrome c-type biogenesis protein CcmH/NrfG
MLRFGTVLAALYAAVAAASWWWLRARPVSNGTAVAAIAAALWVAGVSVAWFVQKEEPRGRSELVRSLDSLAWPAAVEPAPAPARTAAPSADAGVRAESVESLVSRLEARLAAQPNDANGWALLAQSYAYTANEAAGERALLRAVELGVDEQSLRERVAAAKRSAHAGDGVGRPLGTAR